MTLVSVAVCVRNGLDWIDGCMESLVSQSHSPLEIILVDDGSTDGSTDKVNEWASHELVTAITQDPIGLSAGRMAALESAKGEWFAIRCAASHLRVERGWAAWELEEVTTKAEATPVACGKCKSQQLAFVDKFCNEDNSER